MTALQLNPDIYRQLDIIAEDESMFDRGAEQQYARGEYTTQLPGESVEDMLKRCGYVI